MNEPCLNGIRRSAPLTATVEEIAGPLPHGIVVTPSQRTRRRNRPTPAAMLTAIAADAIQAAGDSANIVSVPPAAPGDPALLFLRSRGQTCVMLAVTPDVIRSERLRRGCSPRDLAAEHEYEMLRVAEAVAEYEVEPSDDDDTEL